MGFASFNGRYMLWKSVSSVFGHIRDMKCYCEKKGNEYCPVDEFRLEEVPDSDISN